MDLSIAAILAQDGITTGSIYALLALALVLVFAVTRVIFIPQGEFVAYGALTLASLQAGQVPGTLWLLLAMSLAAAAIDGAGALRRKHWRRLAGIFGCQLAYPLGLAVLLHATSPAGLPL